MERSPNSHYWTLERFSLRFSFYAIIDTEDYLADQLFVREQVRVWFGHEFASPDSLYRVIFCKCRKKDAEAFERALEALPNKMLLCGHRDYITYCKNLKRKMEQVRDHGGDPDDETVHTSAQAEQESSERAPCKTERLLERGISRHAHCTKW